MGWFYSSGAGQEPWVPVTTPPLSPLPSFLQAERTKALVGSAEPLAEISWGSAKKEGLRGPRTEGQRWPGELAGS